MPEKPQPNSWPIWKIAVVVYLPAAGAAAVNIFFLSLMLQRIGLTALSPVASLLWGAIFGVPFAWVGGRWFRQMIDKAESDE